MNICYFVVDAMCAIIIAFTIAGIYKRRKETEFYKFYYYFLIFCEAVILCDVVYEIFYCNKEAMGIAYYNSAMVFNIVGVLCLFLNHRILLRFVNSRCIKNKFFNIGQYSLLLISEALLVVNFFYPLTMEYNGYMRFIFNAYTGVFLAILLALMAFSVGYSIYYAFRNKDLSVRKKTTYISLGAIPCIEILVVFDINVPITSLVVTMVCFVFYFNNLSEINEKNKLILKQKIDLETAFDKISYDTTVIDSIKSMFFCIYYIDLTTGMFEEISRTSVREIHDFIGEAGVAQEKLDVMCESMVVPEQKEEIWTFSRLNTLNERLKNKTSVSIQFNGTHVGWSEGSFIKAKCDEEGNLVGVLWVIKSAKDIKRLEEASYKDQLTGLFNRRAFDEDSNVPVTEDTTVVSFDVNGLKTANDTLGHTAGDELLVGASGFIQSVYGKYGKIYRVGGDEFIAIIHRIDSNSLYDEFRKTTSKYAGSLINEISVSVGSASAIDHPAADIHELVALADQQMYISKRKYHENQK